MFYKFFLKNIFYTQKLNLIKKETYPFAKPRFLFDILIVYMILDINFNFIYTQISISTQLSLIKPTTKTLVS